MLRFSTDLRRASRTPVLLLALVCGCHAVTPEKIASWQADRGGEGPEHLSAALRDTTVTLPLRAQAAAALVDIGFVDRLDGAIAGMPIDERAQLIPSIVGLVARGLGSPDANHAQDAREALFGLRAQATTDGARTRIDDVWFPALEADLRAGRPGGRRTVKDMMVAVASSSVPTLHRVLDDAAAPFETATQILEKVGDRAAREKGGAALARRARAMEVVPAPLWDALGTLAGKDAIEFLLEKVRDRGAVDAAQKAADALVKIRREPALLATALKVAADPTFRQSIRDRMMEVVQNVGGQDAQKGLIELVKVGADPAFRFAVCDAALKMGRSGAIAPVLEAFPADVAITADEIRKHFVDPIYSMGFENREGLLKALESKTSPLARMAAVLTMEKTGFNTDAEFVGKLAKDKGVVKGFPPGDTVGREAQRVAAELKKQPS